jgi:hypothetical protein
MREFLHRLATLKYRDENQTERPVITSEEIEALSIRKGSLTAAEYREVQDHAQMSYEFLRQIPWTDELAEIPRIAYCHHEKLNGSGYPRGILAPAIPLQARIMTVADIYDALTASDRPYKKAMASEMALQILRNEANAGMLDTELVELFIKTDAYRATQDWYRRAEADKPDAQAANKESPGAAPVQPESPASPGNPVLARTA